MNTNDDTTEQPAAEPGPVAGANQNADAIRDDRVIAGVCGGIAERYEVQAGFVRILAVTLALIGGVTIFAYLAAVLLLPQNDGNGNPVQRVRYRRVAQVAGLAAIAIATLMLISTAAGSSWDIAWPGAAAATVLLVVAALVVTVGRRLVAPSPGEASAPTLGRIAGLVLIALAACAAGALLVGLSAASTVFFGAVPSAVAVLLLGLAMLGLGIRRVHVLWLAIPALAIAAPATLLASGNIRFEQSVGERHFAPATESAIQPLYKLGVGGIEVDLRRLQWPEDRPVVVNMKLGLGEARVVVPDDVCVRSESQVRAGEQLLLGESSTGVSLDEPRGQLDRWDGHKLIVRGELDLGQLTVSKRPWKSVGEGIGENRHRIGLDDDSISSQMSAAGCAGAGG